MDWYKNALQTAKQRKETLSLSVLVEELFGYRVENTSIIKLPPTQDDTQWFIYQDTQFRLLHFSHVSHWDEPTANISLQFKDKEGFEDAVLAGTMEVYYVSIPAQVWVDLKELYGDFWKDLIEKHALVVEECRRKRPLNIKRIFGK
jgi:hypothetical protein